MGSEIPKLAKNVDAFLDRVSKEIGKSEEDFFNHDTFYECLDLGMQSPIEQILYIALKAVQKLNSIQDADPIKVDGDMKIQGFYIDPQREIGKYRVDFLVSYSMFFPKSNIERSVVVECDSQEFHERTEQERRYEKQRDRFFANKRVYGIPIHR